MILAQTQLEAGTGTMEDLWHKLFQIDWISSTLVMMICTVGGVIMKAALPVPALAYMAFPVTVFGAFATNAAFRELGITLGSDKMLDVAAGTCLGMTLGATAAIVVFRALIALTSK
ncbi:MAG: hypothetical protein KJZ80_17105 [Hyphomicrobiaceae bacterium]|nr:hypothetical protein [Hyphomicrobiaceae bacterium]